MTTSSGTIFNVEGIEGVDDYSENVSGAGSPPGAKLSFNYCTFLEGGAQAYGVLHGGGAQDKIVASKAVIATKPTNIREGDATSKTVGISFTQGSDTACNSGVNYSMTTNLSCNEAITGAADIKSVVLTNGCEFVITADHKDGCPDVNIDIDQYMGWLSENEWVVGIIYIVLGSLLMVFGLQFFPYVTASLIAIFIMGLCASVGLALGWMESTGGLIAVLAVGLVLGVLAGCLVRRQVWIMIALLGMVTGFFSGSLVFALIASASGWSAVWGWWTISVVLCLAGGALAYFLGKSFVLWATSFVGAYLFTRSWTLFFPGHWPSEAEIMAGDIETDSIFWVFLGVLIFCFIASVCVQKKRNCVHEDLD